MFINASQVNTDFPVTVLERNVHHKIAFVDDVVTVMDALDKINASDNAAEYDYSNCQWQSVALCSPMHGNYIYNNIWLTNCLKLYSFLMGHTHVFGGLVYRGMPELCFTHLPFSWLSREILPLEQSLLEILQYLRCILKHHETACKKAHLIAKTQVEVQFRINAPALLHCGFTAYLSNPYKEQYCDVLFTTARSVQEQYKCWWLDPSPSR